MSLSRKKKGAASGSKEPGVDTPMTPVMSLSRNEQGLLVHVELPGIDANDIKVDIQNKIMTIHAKTGSREYQGKLELGSTPDISKMKASLKNGLLNIELPEGPQEKDPKKSPSSTLKGVKDQEEITTVTLKDAQDKINSLEETLKAVNYQFDRYKSDFENFRRRCDREKEVHLHSNLESFLGDLLPVLDNLERAIDSMMKKGLDESYLKGLEALRAQFLDALKKNGVRPMDSLGMPFDPNLHEAVGTIPSPDMEEGVVAYVSKTGYLFDGKAIRVAEVLTSTNVPRDGKGNRGGKKSPRAGKTNANGYPKREQVKQ